jgi:NAD(P)-dependent dehydrogenase (short-subunit alcohol dehydrogenase family)
MDNSSNHGFRQTTSSTKPIRTPDDVGGFKIPVPPSLLWTLLCRTLGTAPLLGLAQALRRRGVGAARINHGQARVSGAPHLSSHANNRIVRMRLQDKVAIVFGAGSVGPGWGNGKATAVTFARHGARVVCVDINREAAEETVRIIAQEGHRASAASCDVTDSAGVRAVVDAVAEQHGRIDILHNNVGYAQMGGPVELDEAAWHRTLDLNVTGCFLTCKHVLPHMLARQSGAIVNVSSIAAVRYTGYPYAAYYAAKAAVNNFTLGLALQYARDGIRANAIMPGLMNTPLIFQQISGQYADAAEMVKARDEACPMGRMGTAWDVANAALFLASDEAAYITGVSLPVDGGLSGRAS